MSKENTHTVRFEFDCLHKDGAISGKSGEVDINTEASIEQLKKSRELKILIRDDMESKTKKKVIDVRIKEIIELTK